MIVRTLLLLLVSLCAFGQDPLTITTVNVPKGIQGKPYMLILTATGGTLPYIWSIKTGTLPAGLTMNGNVVSGTPTGPEVQIIDFKVKDAATTNVTKLLTLTMQHVWGPYQVPAAATICQTDLVPNPPVVVKDPVTDKKNCFGISVETVTSMTQEILGETKGLLPDGNVDYRYQNWFEYFVASFKKKVLPTIQDDYPSAAVVAAKAALDAAKAALDAAKAAEAGQ